MKTAKIFRMFLIAMPLVFFSSFASAQEFYTETASAIAECRKTSDRGCTAWAKKTITAKKGYLFSIESIEANETFMQNCIKVQFLHRYGKIQNIKTPYGVLPFTDTITLRAACESGGGMGQLRQVYKIAFEGSVIANKID